jgi:hypothetical protein
MQDCYVMITFEDRLNSATVGAEVPKSTARVTVNINPLTPAGSQSIDREQELLKARSPSCSSFEKVIPV